MTLRRFQGAWPPAAPAVTPRKWASGNIVRLSGGTQALTPSAPNQGAAKPSAALVRERLQEWPMTGIVVDSKGTWGWISPHQPVDHPSAVLHGGKIYWHRKDQSIATPLA